MSVTLPVGAGQIPSRRISDDEPLLILGFLIIEDETRALCVTPDGELEWAGIHELVTAWRFDRELEVWISDVATLDDYVLGGPPTEPDSGEGE